MKFPISSKNICGCQTPNPRLPLGTTLPMTTLRAYYLSNFTFDKYIQPNDWKYLE